MQKARNVQYAAAGVQALPGIRLNVRSNVRLPDSEAGTCRVMDQEPYYAAHTRALSRRPHITISGRVAAIFLCGLFLLFGMMIVNKASQRAQIAKNISQIQEDIYKTRQENSQLTLDVANARDQVRICYEAVQRLGMIAATGENSVHVVAPETRPFSNNYHLAEAQDPSPLAALPGWISGSR